MGTPMKQFRLGHAVDRLSEFVIVAVATTADGRLDTRFGQTFDLPNS